MLAVSKSREYLFIITHGALKGSIRPRKILTFCDVLGRSVIFARK